MTKLDLICSDLQNIQYNKSKLKRLMGRTKIDWNEINYIENLVKIDELDLNIRLKDYNNG